MASVLARTFTEVAGTDVSRVSLLLKTASIGGKGARKDDGKPKRSGRKGFWVAVLGRVGVARRKSHEQNKSGLVVRRQAQKQAGPMGHAKTLQPGVFLMARRTELCRAGVS